MATIAGAQSEWSPEKIQIRRMELLETAKDPDRLSYLLDLHRMSKDPERELIEYALRRPDLRGVNYFVSLLKNNFHPSERIISTLEGLMNIDSAEPMTREKLLEIVSSIPKGARSLEWRLASEVRLLRSEQPSGSFEMNAPALAPAQGLALYQKYRSDFLKSWRLSIFSSWYLMQYENQFGYSLITGFARNDNPKLLEELSRVGIKELEKMTIEERTASISSFELQFFDLPSDFQLWNEHLRLYIALSDALRVQGRYQKANDQALEVLKWTGRYRDQKHLKAKDLDGWNAVAHYQLARVALAQAQMPKVYENLKEVIARLGPSSSMAIRKDPTFSNLFSTEKKRLQFEEFLSTDFDAPR